MLKAIRHHWPEYLMESAGLGVFMISAGLFTTLLEYPAPPVHQSILGFNASYQLLLNRKKLALFSDIRDTQPGLR